MELEFIIYAERLAHPRRERKPEFKEGRCPPLDGASCSAWFGYSVAAARSDIE